MTDLSDIELHIPALRRYALALLRKRDDADDLVQASLLRAIDRIASRRKGGDLRAWLFTIMHNLFVNQWHGQRVRDAVMIHDPVADIAVPPGQHVALELKNTLDEALAATNRVLARQDGPTVLVGHSFAGTIISKAGMAPNVSALVYVAARAPDAGEDYAALTKRFPAAPASAGIVFDSDEGRLTEAAFLRDFAGDLPWARARTLYAVQQPFRKELLTGRTTQAAWRSKPSFYAVSTEDRTINPELERFMAKRMDAKTIELKASHVSMISHPREIARLVLKAARSPL